MKCKAVIFDMDGTIVDTENIWAIATKKVLEKYRVTVTEQKLHDILESSRGVGLMAGCLYLAQECDIQQEPYVLEKELAGFANAYYEDGITFIDGFEHFHEKIVLRALANALATNADDSTLEITKQRLQLERFFGSHLYNVSHVNNRAKPDPALYLYAADQLGVDPKLCIAIEDSAHGVTAAKNAGMYCIGINTARSPKSIAHADMIIEHYSEIDIHEVSKKL